jgi:iron(III) transport system substrate-binding protein
MKYIYIAIFGIFAALIPLSGCSKESNRLTVYTTVDQVYAEKIFHDFTRKTGISITPVYDTEAAKGVGIEKRLIAEKEAPKADLFWNSEFMRTIRLKKLGILAPSPFRPSSPYKKEGFFDPQGYWFGLGMRQRIILSTAVQDRKRLENLNLFDIINSTPKGDFAMAFPFAGSTSTHFSALLAQMGSLPFKKVIKEMMERRPVFLSGNSLIADMLVSHTARLGISDSDDLLSAHRDNPSLIGICYDQNSRGNFQFFGTLSLIRGAKHVNEAKKFLRFMLNQKTEIKLIKMGAVQYGLFQGTPSSGCRGWTLSPEKIYQAYPEAMKILHQYFR